MAIINSIASWIMKKRIHQIELFMKYPHDVQNECFKQLVQKANNTEWGKKFEYESIFTPEKFKERVPVQNYESLSPFIERVRRGEENILWPSSTKWFAKSSGTTNSKSKFIPVTPESLEDCHFNGGKDMLCIYCTNYPETQIFSGKCLGLGGSHQVDNFNDHTSYHGDLSAIMLQNRPLWADFMMSPNLPTALMNKWEDKLNNISRFTLSDNITSIAGVPSWMLLLLKNTLNNSDKQNIKQLWPNLEVFFHGGISFEPYRQQFDSIFGTNEIVCLEIYNASEGFFGIQDQKNNSDLLLMLDYGIYYEFIPNEEFGKEHPKTLALNEIEIGQNYAVVISTNSGLWRYQIGDTIRFTSLSPYRFKITGRTKHYINAFGEELMIENAEKAMLIACQKTQAIIREFTAAPVFMTRQNSGYHEWLIEFEKEPENISYFAEMLDNALKSINSDYEAKRYQSLTLAEPRIRKAPEGTFYNWLKSKNKLGGQNKIPRLSNNREYMDQLLSFVQTQKNA